MSILAIVLFILFAFLALLVDRRVWALTAAYPLGVGVYHLMKGEPAAPDSYGGYDGCPMAAMAAAMATPPTI